MTIAAFRGRCYHCGHDHDAENEAFQARLMAAPTEEGPPAGHCSLYVEQSTPCALAGFCTNNIKEGRTLEKLAVPHEVVDWRGMRATSGVKLIDAFMVGDRLADALIEETTRRKRAEILLAATQAGYVRDHLAHSSPQKEIK